MSIHENGEEGLSTGDPRTSEVRNPTPGQDSTEVHTLQLAMIITTTLVVPPESITVQLYHNILLRLSGLFSIVRS